MLFVDEPGCQRLSRGVLKEVAAHTVDLDIKSAQLTICDQLVRKLGVKDREHFETAMRVLEEVAPDRDAWVMQHLGMGPAEGKDLLLTTLGGKRPPAALANNPSVQAVVRLSRFLRWLACSALPNTYAAYCEEKRKWPEASTFAAFWQRVEDLILSCWRNWILALPTAHISLHFDGLRVDRARVFACHDSVEAFNADAMAHIKEKTGFGVQIIEKVHASFQDLVFSDEMASEPACLPEEAAPLLHNGNCIFLGMWRCAPSLQGAIAELAKADSTAGGSGIVVAARCYRKCAQAAGVSLTPHVGFVPARSGFYLIHCETEGVHHCVPTQYNEGSMCTVWRRDRAYAWSAETLCSMARTAIDSSMIVTFEVGVAGARPDSIYEESGVQGCLDGLLDLMAGALAGATAVYPRQDRCVLCSGRLQRKGEECGALVWTGARWEEFRHGRSQCKKCLATHRVTFAWKGKAKVSTITREDFLDHSSDPIVLVSNNLGFRMSYLRQLELKMFRCATSLLGEGSVILQTFPDTTPVNEDNMARRLGSALQLYWSFCEGRFDDVPVDKPFDDADLFYGGPTTGLRTLFSAWRDDPGLDGAVGVRDVVADGNMVLTRKLLQDEIPLRGPKKPSTQPARTRQGLLHRPASSSTAPSDGGARNTAPAARSVLKRPAGAKEPSRCAAAHASEEPGPNTDIAKKRRRTAGVYATVDMRTGEILHFAEMLNAECKAYKAEAVQEVSRHVRIRTHCLDCACCHRDWEERYCQRCLLDKWHAWGHKCSKKSFDPRHPLNKKWVEGCNTQAAEQLWSKTDRLAAIATQLSRVHFRVFCRRYCMWRNSFIRGQHRRDANPVVSLKARRRRGEAKPLRKPAAQLVMRRPSSHGS